MANDAVRPTVEGAAGAETMKVLMLVELPSPAGRLVIPEALTMKGALLTPIVTSIGDNPRSLDVLHARLLDAVESMTDHVEQQIHEPMPDAPAWARLMLPRAAPFDVGRAPEAAADRPPHGASNPKETAR